MFWQPDTITDSHTEWQSCRTQHHAAQPTVWWTGGLIANKMMDSGSSPTASMTVNLHIPLSLVYIWAREPQNQKNHRCNHVMRLWYFLASVNSFFKCACAAIQWGLMSDFLSAPLSASILHLSEQRRLWWDCVDAQARLSLHWSPMC